MYLNDLETALKNFEIAPTTQSSTSVESDSTNMDTVNDPERFGLKNTDQDNIFTYDDSTSKE